MALRVPTLELNRDRYQPPRGSHHRYRDVAVGPDSRTFYVITDNDNYTLGPDGLPTNELENPGAVRVFTYRGSEYLQIKPWGAPFERCHSPLHSHAGNRRA